jgi:hypothetical protein
VGYELSPFIPTLEGVGALLTCGLRGSPALNTVQHHDMHHRFPANHFSLYFTHWDRWCDTLHPKYDAWLFRYGDGGGAADAAVSISRRSSSSSSSSSKLSSSSGSSGGGLGQQQQEQQQQVQVQEQQESLHPHSS